MRPHVFEGSRGSELCVAGKPPYCGKVRADALHITVNGDELTHNFLPAMYAPDWMMRRGQDLAQQFCDLYANTSCDEPLQDAFVAADRAICELLKALNDRARFLRKTQFSSRRRSG